MFGFGKKHFWNSTCFKATRLKKFKQGIIQLSEYITSIEPNAFSKCKNLISVIIPGGIEEIPEGCFDSCVDLSYIVLPKTIKTIGKNALKGCSSC